VATKERSSNSKRIPAVKTQASLILALLIGGLVLVQSGTAASGDRPIDVILRETERERTPEITTTGQIANSLLIIALYASFLIGAPLLANKRGRSPVLYFLIALLFPPLAYIMLLCQPDLEKEKRRQEAHDLALAQLKLLQEQAGGQGGQVAASQQT
jgi:hypothetical protein